MATLTKTDLQQIMSRSIGDEEGAAVEDLDMAFEELGYDSLAVLEVVNHISRVYAIKLDEEELESVTTPAALLAFVNERLREAV